MKLCLAIIGPTASGKSKLALAVAKALKGEIVCLDSTTVYQEFNIGTAKPTPEERNEIRHHLVDVLHPEASHSAKDFVELAEVAIADILRRNRLPILVGGTYFYLRALQHGMYPVPPISPENMEALEQKYSEDNELNAPKMVEALKEKDPKMAQKIHPNDRYRLLRALAILEYTGQSPSELQAQPTPSSVGHSVKWVKYVLAVPRYLLNRQIADRTKQMLSGGLIEETKTLLEKYPQARALSSIGYHEVVTYLLGKLSREKLEQEIIDKTRQLAKRQTTWLRSDPEVRFVDFDDLSRIKLEVENLQFVLGDKTCTP